MRYLETTKIWRGNYAPPMHRLLWQLGVKIRPPHFAGFWTSAILLAIYFPITSGLLMWLTVWSARGIHPLAAGMTSACSGIAFGLLMAIYYAYGKRKYRLPRWEALAPELTGQYLTGEQSKM